MYSGRIDRTGMILSGLYAAPLPLAVLYTPLLPIVGYWCHRVLGWDNTTVQMIFYFVFVLTLLVIGSGITIRRFHDLGLSGYWVGVADLPGPLSAAGLVLWQTGMSGPNEYGMPQSPRTPMAVLFGKPKRPNAIFFATYVICVSSLIWTVIITLENSVKLNTIHTFEDCTSAGYVVLDTECVAPFIGTFKKPHHARP